ncbi:hypothetical protein Aasi_1918 [Candidatus Amoebophilus asiaticus 5a2]|uniref:Uncharacterized protein n=1 Tax=Amoebophilus asiaticus (strain 5a2) TaxID=452471 RepID=C3L491_AMOA5|nr:hypothetical protein Aasi_1918 [Candidatus Amoebophilus asiaticus 5a2]
MFFRRKSINYPKCSNIQNCKNEITKRHTTLSIQELPVSLYSQPKSGVKPIQTKRLALQLYLEGLGFRAIGNLLQISYGTVYQWIEASGEQATLPTHYPRARRGIELDELHTYVGSKKYC